MPDEREKGFMDKAKGKAKDAWGSATDDKSTESEGKLDKAKGEGREKYADAKEEFEKRTGDGHDKRES